jgi:predicted permease
VGVRMFDSENAPSLKKALLNPNSRAIAAGLITLFTRLKLPEPVALAFSDVAAMIGPLSMMITGMMIGGMTFRSMFSNRRVFGVIFFRMILASGLAVLAAALVVRFLPVDRNIVMIILLGAIAPSASNINQVAILYNRAAGYASSINVLTTLSCIITIPLWIMLFETLIG